MNDWRDVKQYEGLYQVNSKGEIYSLISNKILTPFYRGSRPDNKYMVVDLHKNKKGKIMSVHRIVAESFISNPNNLPCVNHKDGNKYNNCVDNLEWCTYSEDNYHAFQTGLKHIKNGTENKLSKLTQDEVSEIKRCLILGDSIYGARPLARKYGVDHNVILDIYHNIKYTDVQVPYTLFACSDIHSAYTPWMEALLKAGFNSNKYNHKIILCGDLFDRMDESREVYDFVTDMINKDKLIYIAGNHESLLRECCERGYPLQHDWHNGTARTIIDLAPDAKTFEEACNITYAKIKPLLDSMVNYFETKNYVFTHGYVPYDKYTDWRESDELAWEDARWNNGMQMVDLGYEIDKCVVVGHYHTSWGRAKFEDKPEWGENADFSPFYYKNKLIAIDACCAYSHQINCLVIEDDFI